MLGDLLEVTHVCFVVMFLAGAGLEAVGLASAYKESLCHTSRILGECII